MTDEKEVTAEVTSQDAEFRARAEESGIPKIVISMYHNALRRLVENEKKAELREATEAVNDPAVNNLRTLQESIRMLRAERDALLEALQRYVHHFGDPLKCARAAIAKATGEAA